MVLFTIPEAQRIADARGQFDYIGVAARPGSLNNGLPRTFRPFSHPGRISRSSPASSWSKKSQDAIHKALGFLNTGLLIFGIVALAVGAFIIYNTFSIIVAQRSREMALLRAIGASRRQVLTSVVGESLVVGVLASSIGIAARHPARDRAARPHERNRLRHTGARSDGTRVCRDRRPDRRDRHHTVVGAHPGTHCRADATDRGDARRRDRKADRRGVRLSIGGAVTGLGLSRCCSACSATPASSGSVSEPCSSSCGVFVLGPLYARAIGLGIGRPIASVKGVTGEIARENVGATRVEPRPPRPRLDDRRRADRVHRDLRRIGEGSFSSAIDSQSRVTTSINSGGSFGGTGLSPQLGRQIAALPEIAAVAPLRVGQVGDQRQQRVRRRDQHRRRRRNSSISTSSPAASIR